MSITFVHPYLLIALILGCLVAAYYKWCVPGGLIYRFSSLVPFQVILTERIRYRLVPFILRFLSLLALALALGRPRVPDEQSRVDVRGIDIMLVLDVSGSMANPADYGQRASKFDVAQREAISFIQKRLNDQIGIVLFAQGTLVRAPLTFDKQVVSQIMQKTELGSMLPWDGTDLATGLLAALNKLKESRAQSKIAILLTDGNPSDSEALLTRAIELAKKMGVKVYTIGIGQEAPSKRHANFFGHLYLNVDLLKRIAHETGAQAFVVQHAKELERIYSMIDQLEKTDYQKPDYASYFEWWPWLIAFASLLFLLELFVIALWWVRIW